MEIDSLVPLLYVSRPDENRENLICLFLLPTEGQSLNSPTAPTPPKSGFDFPMVCTTIVGNQHHPTVYPLLSAPSSAHELNDHIAHIAFDWNYYRCYRDISSTE